VVGEEGGAEVALKRQRDGKKRKEHVNQIVTSTPGHGTAAGFSSSYLAGVWGTSLDPRALERGSTNINSWTLNAFRSICSRSLQTYGGAEAAKAVGLSSSRPLRGKEKTRS